MSGNLQRDSGETPPVRFAADINPLLAEAFLEEAPLHASRFAETVARLRGESPRLDDVVAAQRVAHTLKGSANITGVSAIADLTHRAEDVLDWLSENATLPPPELGETLVQAADCLAAMVDALREGGAAPAAAAEVLARLRRWREDRGGTPAPAAPAAAASVGSGPVEAPAATTTATAAVAPEGPVTQRPSSATLRVSVDLVERLLRLAGEFAISNVQSQGAHQRMTVQANSLREQYHLVQQRLSDLQDVVEIRGVPSGQRAGRVAPGAGAPGQDFDPLELDEYNELHSKSTALTEAVTDFCEVALGLRPELAMLEDTIADQQRISKELSDSVLSARMVPMGSIEPRLQRAVRETARVTGRDAQLLVSGGSILVDGDVLTALVDPLVHVLRNAVDHGIESPAQREAAGKPPTGTVQIAFQREGDSVLVQVSDDGRGFDLERVRQVARARGALADGEQRTERELLQLAVAPGFSTRDRATQVSGRGIGMDVVHRAVLDLKGSMDIASSPGQGACIGLRVPLTLISMHVLLVRAGDRVFGVPSAALRQVLFSDAGSLSDEGGVAEFSIEDEAYQVRHLAELTGGRAEPVDGNQVSPLLLLDADSGPTAVFVDAAVDGRYLVVKSLGERVPRPGGVIGASILGDGSVAPVLDLRELLRHAAAPVRMEPSEALDERPQAAEPPEVLIVDDSLTARRMLSLTVADAGYRVRTAIDGLDAVEAMEDSMPDLVVTDLEMPRMNGLELAAHLRADTRTCGVPLLMVTSRSTDKHRGLAEAAGINDFITKPYANEELLERLARLLDTAPAAA